MLKEIKITSDKFYKYDYIIFFVQFLKLILFLCQFHMRMGYLFYLFIYLFFVYITLAC